MKKLLSILTMLVLSISMYAQREVTKFLGIPVDGTKSEMIRKLKAKGFEEIPGSDGNLFGEFNGSEVILGVQTNNNKVWRIVLMDAYVVDEAKIKVRFNRLCQQFSNNPKYVAAGDADYSLSEDFKISYEIDLHHKQIEATFFQKTSMIENDVDLVKRCVWFLISISKEKSNYGKYRIFMFYENRDNAANGEDL